MPLESQDDEARRDDAATESPADNPSEKGSEKEAGGPYGNPAVDEENLRKQQEESSERSD